MFKLYPILLIRARPMSSNVVVFLRINPKEKLVVYPTETYQGLIKWVFLLEDSPNSSDLGTILLIGLDSISSTLSSSPILLISLSNTILSYFLSRFLLISSEGTTLRLSS